MARPENVLWIGGRSGAGKSTVARLLARRHGLRWYSCDTRTWEHRDRAIAAGHPAALEWEQLTADQRSRLSPTEAIRLTIDRADMVRADVSALPDTPAVLAEGTDIRPGMVPRSSLALWFVARPTTRARRARQRGWGAAGGAVDLMHERALLAELERASAVMIDTTDDSDPLETLVRVERLASDWLNSRPAARTREERQLLIRDGNAAIVSQYRSGRGRSGNAAADPLRRTYDCECGRVDCAALVDRELDSVPEPFTADAAPILAPGHSRDGE